MGSTTSYEASTTIGEITSSSDGSTSTTFTVLTPSTAKVTTSTYLITQQRPTGYSTWEHTTFPSPTYPESTPNVTISIIVLIVFSLGVILIIYCVFTQNRRAKLQRSRRNLNNAALMANYNSTHLRCAPPIYPHGITSPFTSVTVNDQLPDYDAVIVEPASPRELPPQLIIRSFAQEDDSPPPNYVTPDVNTDSHAMPFTSPLPPTYDEAISQPNSRWNPFTKISIT